MKLSHRHIVRRASYLAKHPWTRRVVIGMALILFVTSIGIGQPSQAASHTRDITAKADWDRGTLNNVDTEATRDSIQLVADGSWAARSLAEPPDNIGIGSAFTSDRDHYVYVASGGQQTFFWRYDSDSNTWLRLADTPYPTSYGASLAFDSNGHVYGTFGGYLKKFARYTIATDTWEALADTPDVIYVGSALAFDRVNQTLYLLLGNTTQGFYSYTYGGIWANEPAVPATVAAGGTLVYYEDGANEYLYALRGSNTLTTYRLNLNVDPKTWSDPLVADLPAGLAPNDDSKSVWLGDYLYFLRATNTQSWMRYKIADPGGNVWSSYTTSPSYVPLALTGYSAGLGITTSPDRVYVFRGNNTRQFWVADPSTSPPTWVGPHEPIIANTAYTVTTGSSMDSDGARYIYLRRGSVANQKLMQFDTQAAADANPWTLVGTNNAPNVSLDTYGVLVGDYIYSIIAANQMNRFRISTLTWDTALTMVAPFNGFGNGGGLVYPGSGTTIYAARGGGQAGFYSFDTTTWNISSWSDVPADLPQTNQATVTNLGGRMFANSTDVYLLLGNGSNRLMRYNIELATWYEDQPAPPFSPYYGTAVEFDRTAGKAYVTAGYYKNDIYEFTVGGTWRKLRDAQAAATSNISFYAGASLAKVGTTLYALRGNATTDFYSYSISTSTYATSGTYESPVYDFSYVSSWTSITTSDAVREDLLTIEARSSVDGVTWPDAYAAIGSTAARRYLQVRISLASADTQATTPKLGGYTVTYVGDSSPPTNPSSVTAKPSSDSQTTLTPSTAYPYSSVYFQWPLADAAGGATDAGSGVAGYYVYFGPSAVADPDNPGDGGFYTTTNSFTTNTPMSDGNYYLRVITIDNDGTPAAAIWDAFTYIYDDISPLVTTTVTDQTSWDDGTVSNTSYSQSDGNVQLSSSSGNWVQDSVALPPGTLSTGAGSVYRADEDKIYILRGASRNFYSYSVTANTWNATEGDLAGAVNVGAGGGIVNGPGQYMYAWLGGSTTTWMRYDTETNTWDDSAGVSEDLSQPITTGAKAVFDGSRYIYFVRGGNTNDFWRYDTNSNTWDSGFNVDLSFGNPVNQLVNGETDMAFDGNRTIYLLQSTGYAFFAKFTIPEDMTQTGSWSQLAPAPSAFNSGTSLTFDSTNSQIYALSGYRDDFMKYSIATNTWTKLSDMPISVGAYAFIKKVGDNVYAFRAGNTQGVYKFNITQQIWYKPVTNTFGINANLAVYNPLVWSVGAGASVVKGDGDYYYATRGNTDNNFIRYNYKTSEVTELMPLPMGVTTGASIVYAGAVIYATTGSNSQNFYKYTLATNSWAQVNTASTKLVPATLGDGSDMVYDGTRYIYLVRGANGTQVYKFDTNDDTWLGSGLPPALPAALGAGGSLVYAQNPSDSNYYIYALRGASTVTFYMWQIGAGAWTNVAGDDPSVTVSTGGFIASGGNGKLYMSRGALGTPPTDFFEYSIGTNTWTAMTDSPAEWSTGGDMSGVAGEQVIGFVGQGANAVRDGIYSYNIPSSTTGFSKTGTYTSVVHDFSPTPGDNTQVYKWGNLTTKYSEPTGTSVLIETSSSTDGSSWSDFVAVSNELEEYSLAANSNTTRTFTINSPARQYLKIRYTLNSDGLYSPNIESYSVNYYIDLVSPENPTSVVAYSSSAKTGDPLSDSPAWNNSLQPHFVLPTLGAAGAATDNANGSGVDGYYLYFGTDGEADASSSSGILLPGSAIKYQTTYEITVTSSMTSGQTYYFRVRTKDKGGRNAGTTSTLFTYKYDRTAPTFGGTVGVTPSGWTSVDDFDFTWSAASKAGGLAPLVQYEYRTGGDAADDWTVMDPPTGLTVSLPNANHPQGQYLDGDVNYFYVRAIDAAGNSTTLEGQYKYSTAPVGPPINLQVFPSEPTTENSFTVTWDPPDGEEGYTYRYAVNSFPLTEENTTLALTNSVGPLPLATQNGTNTFRIVTVRGANVNYNTVADITFDFTSTQPSAPQAFQVEDFSDRDTQKYGAVLSWETPEVLDEGNFKEYRIYRSTDNITFAAVATSTELSYVTRELTGNVTYYFYVTAANKTGEESVSPSPTLSVLPTGKFKLPPTIVQSSVESQVRARKVQFEWVTTRAMGSGAGTSFVKCGLTADNLPFTAGDFDQVIQHSVSVEGLTPDTQYLCFLYSADIDGNTQTYGPIQLTTSPPPKVSPVVDEESITLSKATINFTTNVKASGFLYYGPSKAFGSSVEFKTQETTFNTKLVDLLAGTTYYYSFRLVSEDGDTFGQEVDLSFKTKEQPAVKDLKAEPKMGVDTPSLDITYKTNVSTNTTIYYSTDNSPKKEATTSEPYGTEHTITISGLQALKAYTIIGEGKDVYGNSATTQTIVVSTLDDTKPPEIIEFRTDSRAQSDGKTTLSAKVQTNEPTTAQLEVGQGAGVTNFPNVSQQSELNQSHTLSVSVSTGSVYSVRVKVTDSAGNITYSKVEDISSGVKKPTPIQLVSKTLSKNFGWISKLWKK